MAGRARTDALVLLGYCAVAFAYFGERLVLHPGRYLLGTGRDPQIYVWAFAWWPYAVEGSHNPFYTHAVYAPLGINLAWTTTVPGLALAFAPLTQFVGPAASYNVAAMLAPALSAWTAYLLCRHLTGSRWAALVGGYLFGFSSYELAEELGHLAVSAVFLVPLVVLALVRYLEQEIDARGLGWRLGVLFGLEFWISTEITFTLSLALLAGILLAYAILAEARPRLRAAAGALVRAGALAALIAAPLLYYAITGFTGKSINASPSLFDGDLLNFVVPTHLVALGGSSLAGVSAHFPASDAERGAYLGLPTLVIVAWYAARRWRRPAARLLLALLAVAVLVTLGTGVVVEGRVELWLPWRPISRLPLFDNVLPVRIAMYGSLVAAMIVALWTASQRGLAARVLPLLAVAALVPALWQADYRIRPSREAFFTTGVYRQCILPEENVAIFPFGAWGDSMLWQAESGFWFRMPEGYLQPFPPAAELADPTIAALTYTQGRPSVPQLISFVEAEKVDRIVSVIADVYPDNAQMFDFGNVQNIGDVLVAPGCGYPSLAHGIHPTTPPG